MIRTFALLLLLGCATSNPAVREIRAQYDALERAYAARDIDAVLASRSPDFETFGPQGQHDTYATMAEYTRQWLSNNKPPIDSKFTIESVEYHSSDEVAVHVLQRVSRYQDRDGKRVHVVHEVRQRETWIRTPQGWRLRKVDQIDLAHRKRWVDGKLEAPR
jgi:ketosteroid isomerase-like protein